LASDPALDILHRRPENADEAAYTTRIQDFVGWSRKNSLR
jgi:hypothetical protein